MAILVIAPVSLVHAEPGRPVTDPHFKTLAFGREQVPEVAEPSWVTVDFADLPTKLKGQMYDWLAFIIAWEAHPQKRGYPLEPGPMAIRVFAASRGAASDSVEYRWSVHGQNIRAVATRNAIRFDIDLDALTREQAVNDLRPDVSFQAKAFVESILLMEGKEPEHGMEFTLRIPWPDTLIEGVEFSTNPEKDLNHLIGLHERVDFFLKNRTLSILFYKKPAQLAHFQDGSKWFDDEFRALVHRKAREQGKLVPED